MDLLEREAQLGQLSAVVEAARAGSGRVAVVEGEPGIGKTTLLDAAVVAHCGDSIGVLRARGGELERDFGFGVARQLFGPHLSRANARKRERLLAGAAGFATPALGLEVGPPPGPDAVFAVQHGLYWLAANVAADGGLVIVVDDAQWSDAPSLRWLVYLTRRLEGLPISILLGWRTGEPDAPLDLLELLRAEPLVETVVPAPLSETAGARIVRARIPQAEDGFCAACREASGGNPFLLGELVGAVISEDVEQSAAGALRVRDLGPRTVARAVFLRLARLGPDETALARAAAVLDADAELRFAAELAGLDPGAAARAAARLAEAHVFAAAPAALFAHPVLRAAVYEDLEVAARAREHRRAAAVLIEGGADPDRAALHLLRAVPAADPWVVELLADAGRRAFARGAHDTAVQLLQRALDEPTPGDVRPGLLLSLGLAAWHAGRADATDFLRLAAAEAGDPFTRATASATLARMHASRLEWESGRTALAQAIAELPDPEGDFARQLAALNIAAGLAAGFPIEAVARDARRLHRKLEPETPLRRLVAGLALFTEVVRSDGPRAGAVTRLAGELGDVADLAAVFGPDFAPLHFPLIALGYVDSYAIAVEALDAVIERGRATAQAAWALGNRAWQRYHLGDLAAAESDARELLNLANVMDDDLLRINALGWLSLTLGETGAVDAAERELELHGLDGPIPETGGQDRLFFYCRASLRSNEGRHDLAGADVERFLALHRKVGAGAFGPIVGACPRLLVLGGDRQAARRLAEQARDAAAGAPFHGARGMALHSAGLCEAHGRAAGLLEQAVAELERSPLRLELARALADLGAALRRDNRRADAREPLRRAMELGHRLGATAIAERARDELRATGARPRRLVRTGLDSLTASERRVCELAAQGLRIDDVAQALFVTRKTVETHLYSSYRKLDVDSREALAAALREER